MSKTILAAALAAAVLLALPLEGSADSQHGGELLAAPEEGHHASHGGASPQVEGLAGAWAALMAGRDAIAGDVESGALGEIHTKAEPLPRLAAILLERSGGLDAGKRARVEGAAKQMARVAEALHVAADGGHAARTRKALSQLDGLLELIRTQYPVGALNEGSGGYGDHSNTRDSSPAAHAHRATPAGVVHVPPEAIVHVRALDTLRFEPRRIEVQAGIPTRIELENAGAAEHSLVVKTAGGDRDWVHIHVLPGASEAATYRLDTPGTYPVLCTIPGHTEAGMVGELVVLVR